MRPSRPLLCACAALLCALGAARSQDVAPTSSTVLPRASKSETVLRLVSEELVRGQLVYLAEGDLSLDGDKTGERVYDWKDVVELRSNERVRVTLADGRKLLGLLSLDPDGQVRILCSDGSVHIALQRDVLTAWPAGDDGERPELSKWSGTISLSLTSTYGNTRTANLLGSANLLRQSGDWWWRLSGELSQATDSGEETIKYRRGESSLEYDLTLHWFVVPVYVRAEYDKFQNIDLRLRAGSGLGYRILRGIDIHWQVEATALFSRTQYRHVEPAAEETEDGSALRLASIFQVDLLDDDLGIAVNVQSFVGLDDIENTTHQAKLTVAWKLVSDLTVNLTFTWNRVENPQRNDDGTIPERDDFQLGTGLGWKF